MDRRSLIAAALVAPVAISAPAVAQTMFCAPADDRIWQELVAAERQAFRAQNSAQASLEEAEKQYEAKVPDLGVMLDRPFFEGNTAEIWNRQNAEIKARWSELVNKTYEECGIAGLENRFSCAITAHQDALEKVIAFPTRDPERIRRKIALVIEHHQFDALEDIIGSIN